MVWLSKDDARVLLDAIQYALGAMPDSKAKRVEEQLYCIMDGIQSYMS